MTYWLWILALFLVTMCVGLALACAVIGWLVTTAAKVLQTITGGP